MSNSPTSRNRWMLPAPKAPIAKAAEFLKRSDVWSRVGLCLLTVTILWIITFGWAPPFSYRVRQAPLRNVDARTVFEVRDQEKTEEAKRRARTKVHCVYENDRRPLEDLRLGLFDDLFELKAISDSLVSPDEPVEESDPEEPKAKTFAELDTKVWEKFFNNSTEESSATEESFRKFIAAIAADEKLETLKATVSGAFIEIDRHGLFEDLEHDIGQGNMQEIEVYQKGNPSDRERFNVSDIRIVEMVDNLESRLADAFAKEADVFPDNQLIAKRIYSWMRNRLPVTLKWDQENSRLASNSAARSVPVEMHQYQFGDALKKLNYVGDDEPVISGGVPLDLADIELLATEHLAYVKNMTWTEKTLRSVFFFGLFGALFSMFCSYLYYRDQTLLKDLRHFSILLGLMLFAFTMAWIVSLQVEWRSEIIPMMIFAMTVAIAYNIELSIMLSTLVSIAFVVAHGFGLGELVVLTTACSTAALLCRSIRSRTKLVYIGLISAAIVFPVAIGVNYLLGQPLGSALLIDAIWYAGGAGLAGLFMTALLPFLEQLFDIQTDISLLELSDANHPLLKELVQRAPGTYNHSINVASIAEAAADSIGANGLLCRVGAYFHDVGKLRKPDYFIENQGGGVNKHDELVPTMSTLVIIAHVKDGAEIARSHRLPTRIIDLIEQHHGTTLVEYFYKRAAKQNEEAENGTQVDESDFRYPGPRPQTPEAAVMMMADCVESASRALREPTPARLESLVRELAKKRLDDGQFDECSITLEQLNTIQESLIKSLNAMYHARVKYPDQQQTA